MDKRTIEPVAVVGLGLMGRSIIACLLAAGHPVVGLTPQCRKPAATRGNGSVNCSGRCGAKGSWKKNPAQILARLEIGEDYAALSGRTLVIESVIEDWDVKKQTLRRVEERVRPDALIGSNTSAIPVTLLQKEAPSIPSAFSGFTGPSLPISPASWRSSAESKPVRIRGPNCGRAGARVGQRADADQAGHSRLHHQPHHVRDDAGGILSGRERVRDSSRRGPLGAKRSRLVDHVRRAFSGSWT